MKFLFLVDCMERYSFFLRLARALEPKHSAYFATTEPLVALLGKINKIETFFLRKNNTQIATVTSNKIFSNAEISIEYLNGDCSIHTAENHLTFMISGLKEFVVQAGVDKLIIWNGQQLLGRAGTLVAAELGIAKLYLEIANLPNKMFSDELGVNALSSFSQDISIIDRLVSVPEDCHNIWMGQYEEAKSSPLPQSRKKTKHKILDTINFAIKVILCQENLRALFAKVSLVIEKPIDMVGISTDNAVAPYVFLPLQVSGDTQIKLHSEFDNIAAIKEAHRCALMAGCSLIVKIHPAERSKQEIKRVIDLHQKLNFFISSKDTISLIKNSQSVITINSTVGLEALLYNKNTTALGRCFYSDFDRERLKKYIHRYLVSGINYFDNEKIQLDLAENLLRIK